MRLALEILLLVLCLWTLTYCWLVSRRIWNLHHAFRDYAGSAQNAMVTMEHIVAANEWLRKNPCPGGDNEAPSPVGDSS